MGRVDRLRTLFAVVALLAAAGLAGAQAPPVAITAARVGLPAGAPVPGRIEGASPGHVVKFATWAPLYLELEVRGEIPEPAELVVETPDGDEVNTTLAVPVPALTAARPGQIVSTRDFAVMPYVRVASGTSDTIIRVRTAGGTELAEPFRIRGLFPANARSYVVLSLGSRLPGFDLPKDTNAEESNAAGFRNGRLQTAAIVNVEDLPDHWFGYDAADLVVLATGTASDDFLRRLFGEQASAGDRARREALLEWVRRGGRLVVSVGGNASLLAQLPAFRDFLPFAFAAGQPSRAVTSLFFRWKSAGGTPQNANLSPKAGTMAVAALVPRPEKPAAVLLDERRTGETNGAALAVQAAFGLGRVTLLAFDLDRPPFTDYAMKADFWDWVLREGGSPMASAGSETKAAVVPGLTEEEDELAAALRTHVDTFEGVPVISFGWVAVFVVLYILLIGPVEYFVLKRVFGRLELTWITFPIIVLSVSAAAYFTAYAVKGHDLRVNKVDVVEVDPASGRVYGQSWFTVFSPRIDTYTVTVSPAAGWTAETPEESARETLTGWTSGPRGGRASLIRRGYQYHVNADGRRYADALDNVPIQVWSTKTFSARWSARLDAASPVIESKLVHPVGDPSSVVGTIVNRMPLGEIRDAVAIYAGQAYPTAIGTLVPGVERQIVLKNKPSSNWLADDAAAVDRMLGLDLNKPGRINVAATDYSAGSAFPMLGGVLFHEAATRKDQGVALKNASLRSLDQSWRLNAERRNEVIVVGRLAVTNGPAEEALGERFSPSQLWLKGMPGDGRPRTPLTGAGRQETYVRLYLPVK